LPSDDFLKYFGVETSRFSVLAIADLESAGVLFCFYSLSLPKLYLNVQEEVATLNDLKNTI
jgi:hypothetical protein